MAMRLRMVSSKFYRAAAAIGNGGAMGIKPPAKPKAALHFRSLSSIASQLRRVHVIDAVGIQHIPERHDAFQLVNIRPVDYGQDIEMVCAHAFEREMQGMIHVDMRNMECFHKVSQRMFFSAIDKEI